MKKFLQILWLKYSVYTLRNERERAIANIYNRNPKRANRVANIEDINPTYFEDIDIKINSRERLIETLSK